MADPTPPPLPSELPVLPLRLTVAFPLTLQPLAVNRPVSIETVNRALGSDRLILLVLQDNDKEDPGPDDVPVPAPSGRLATLAYLFPWFARRIRPRLALRGEAAKKAYMAQKRGPGA